MAGKNQTEVLIDGRIYRLSGYESEEYLQRVASYLSSKIAEIKKAEGYHRLSQELRSIMLDLNVADDYFKTKKKAEGFEEQIAAKDKEIYEVKRELVALQVELETAGKTIETLRDKQTEDEKKIAALEAQLAQRSGGGGGRRH